MATWLLVLALLAAFGCAVTCGLIFGLKAGRGYHEPRHFFPLDLDAEDARRTAWLEKTDP